jgi:hypothetical protein
MQRMFDKAQTEKGDFIATCIDFLNVFSWIQQKATFVGLDWVNARAKFVNLIKCM